MMVFLEQMLFILLERLVLLPQICAACDRSHFKELLCSAA